MCRTAFISVLIGLVAGLLVPAGASAQCRLCSATSGLTAEEAPGTPLKLEVESILSFDRLVQISPGEGAAVLRPDGTKIVTGSLGDFSGAGLVGTVIVHGEAGRLLRIDMPNVIELHSLSGTRAIVDEIVTDLPDAPRLDGAGRLSFKFGGRFNVNGEADGDYRGDLPITAEYL